MNRFSKMCLVLCILLIFNIFVTSMIFSDDFTSENKIKKIEEHIRKQMKKGKIPGLAVTIIKDDETVYQKNFGYQNIKNKIPVSKNTLFELGSTSKAFTGLGVLLLEKQGSVSLDDSITKYIPWLKMKYKGEYVDLKVRHFLYQSSGIPFKTIGDIPVSSSNDALTYTIKNLIDIELEHKPGEKFLYATVNYDVLGLLIQQVSGMSYEDYIEQNIIKPLGMESTYVFRSEAYTKEEMATGYKAGFLKQREYFAPTYRGNTPAGYMITNIKDLSHWIKLQLGTISVGYEDIIQQSHKADRSVKPTNAGSSYAAGWEIYQSGGGQISHSGSNPNFASHIVFRPQEQIGVGVLSNTNSDYTINIGQGIMDILQGIEPKMAVQDMASLDNVFFSVFCVSMLLNLATLIYLFKSIIEVIQKKRKRVVKWSKSLLTAFTSMIFVFCFGYCLYIVPKVLYDGLPWNFVTVWGSFSFIPAVISVFIASILLAIYFQFIISFEKKDEKPFFPLIVLSFISGFGNAFIIFTISEALNRKNAISSGLFLYFLLGIVIYVLGQKIIRTNMISITNQMVYTKRIELIEKVLRTPFCQFEKIEDSKIFASLNNDTEVISRMPNVLVGALTSLVTLLCCFVYLGSISMVGLLMSFGIIVCAATLYFFVGRSANKLWERARDIQNEFFGFINDLVHGFKELSLNGAKRNGFEKDIEKSCGEYRDKRVLAAGRFVNVFVIGELLFTIVIGSVAFIFPLIFKEIPANMLQTYVFVFLYMTGPLHGVLDNIPEMFTIRISWKRIDELISDLEKVRIPTSQNQISNKNNEAMGYIEKASHKDSTALEVRDINYQYINNDEVFNVGPINLEFKHGETTFITGGNGSGKTSLAKLITGLYKADSGEILINGVATSYENLGESYSCVFSDYYLFKKLYGINHDEKVEVIEDWLKILQIEKKLSIKDGIFSTTSLSSGQRKRLALLVSYLEDNEIFLFDEWAADQDPEFKNYFYNQLLPELRNRNKCIIAITHDDHYYNVADRVVKLNMGKVESISKIN